jgi:RNA polymerase sigma factor (sigma-70 family)
VNLVGEAATSTFEEAFDDCYRVAYRAAFRLLGQRAEAQDIAQEAMTRAYVRWSRVRGYAEAWVVRVATNLALDVVRRASRTSTNRVGVNSSDDDRREERLDLANALAKLPRRQREVVSLRFIADRTEDEVARLLGCSIGTVKQHAHRGLGALRASIGPEAVPA